MSDGDDSLDEKPARPPSVAPGSRFGKYEMLRKLGEGGMGTVYEARHVDLDKRVALKVLRSKLAKNRTYLERFLREGRIAAKLDHPHVVDVSDVGTEGGVPFLVMEFLSGRDLDGFLDERGPLDAAEAIDLLLPILSALDAAHGAGLVHRDLKPANIFLCRAAHGGLHPKLLDFGIAKPGAGETEALTGTAEVFGTPQYMAPEQVRRTRDAKAASDQYAMGVVLYRCVVGREAFELGDSSMFEVLERVVAGRFPAPRARRPDVDEALERIILRAMAKDPADRYPSVLAFGRELLPFASPPVRQTWTAAFSTRESMAETIAPLGSSGPATAPTVVHARSAPDQASGPRPRVRSPAGTLAAAEVDSRAGLGATTALRGRAFVLLGAVAGLALSATIYFVATRSGRAGGGSSVSASARAEPDPSAAVDLAVVGVVAGSVIPPHPAPTASALPGGASSANPSGATASAIASIRAPSPPPQPRPATSTTPAVSATTSSPPAKSANPTPSYTIE